MKTAINDFKKRFKAVRRLKQNEGADRALSELEKMIKEWPDHPRLLVEKSRLVQLSENGILTDAKRALQRAINVDEASPDPWTELGYYLLVIDNQATKAEEKFDRALELGLRQLIEAVTGKVYAILDQDEPLPRNKLNEAADLIRLGEMLAGHYQKDDSPEVEWLCDVIAQYHERFTRKPVSHRNGRNGT